MLEIFTIAGIILMLGTLSVVLTVEKTTRRGKIVTITLAVLIATLAFVSLTASYQTCRETNSHELCAR